MLGSAQVFGFYKPCSCEKSKSLTTVPHTFLFPINMTPKKIVHKHVDKRT